MNNDKTKIPNIDKNEVTIGDCFEFNQKDDLIFKCLLIIKKSNIKIYEYYLINEWRKSNILCFMLTIF